MALAPAPTKKTVVVFGASWCKPGDDLYRESEKTGAAIAAAGFSLINGGYYGTMEGSAKGHSEVEGSPGRHGVIVPTLFKSRDHGNPFLTQTTHAESLLGRIEHMITGADYFIVMPGTLGTLLELCAVWSIASLAGEGHYVPPKVYCYRQPWEKVVSTGIAELGIPAAIAAHVLYVKDGAEAMDLIAADFAVRAAAAAAAPADIGSGAGATAVGAQ